MRINSILYGVLVLTVFFGVILGFQAAGVWSISGKVDASGAAIAPSAGDVNTIKGWMTLEQIAATFNVPLADLLEQFDLSADTPPTTATKDLESETFDTTALRTWLQSRIELVSATPAPIIDPKQSLGSTPTAPPTETLMPTVLTTPAPTEHIAPEKTITGKTTFQELLDWGVSKDVIQL